MNDILTMLRQFAGEVNLYLGLFDMVLVLVIILIGVYFFTGPKGGTR